MKRILALLVALAVFGFAVSHVWARGGGHGGGHHGGGHHGGHHGSHHSSHHHSHHGNHHHSHHHSGHHYHHTGWAHHGGWGGWGGGGWGGWGWGNPWAVAGFGTTAAWLGLEGLNNATPIVGNYGGPAIVENNETNNNGDVATNDNNVPQTQTADVEDESDDEPVISPAQRAEANKLLQAGAKDPEKGTKFLPLGVYSLAPRGHENATALAQLAVSKEGVIRGTYHDLLSNHDQPIRGTVDKKSQRVVFSFGDKGKVTFETSLANLTKPTGGAFVHSQGGESSPWTLARYEKEPTAKDEAEEAAEEAEDKAADAREEATEAPAAPATN